MKRSEVFPSRYLSKEDVPQPVRAIIVSVVKEGIKTEKGTESRPVMHFQGASKPMILNTTNWGICEESYGEDSDAWIGKPVWIYTDPNVMFAGRKIGGLRFKIAKTAHPIAAVVPSTEEVVPVDTYESEIPF